MSLFRLYVEHISSTRFTRAFFWFFGGMFLLYVCQVICALAVEVFPSESRTPGHGVTVHLKRGFGLPVSLLPGIGMIGILGPEPCRVIVRRGNVSREHGIDIAWDMPLDQIRARTDSEFVLVEHRGELLAKFPL